MEVLIQWWSMSEFSQLFGDLLQLLMSQVAVWQPQGLPGKFSKLETLQHSFDDQPLCLLSIQIANGRGHIQTLIWPHSQDEGGRGPSSHLVGV